MRIEEALLKQEELIHGYEQTKLRIREQGLRRNWLIKHSG